MNKRPYRDILDSAAADSLSRNINLWPGISTRLQKDTLSMKPKMKLTWSLVLVILALILGTTIAYALYRFFADPGLQSVNDAGLITDINTTAQPTLLPPQDVFADGVGPVMVGEAQTAEGVTVTLDWVFLEDGQQLFHVSSTGLAPEMRFGMPVVNYTDVTPEQYRGALFSLDDDAGHSATFISYQLLRKDGQPGGNVDMQIDIPLLRDDSQAAVFHFDVSNVPVVTPNGGGGGNSYAVRVDGLEMRLEHAIVTPSYTKAQLCYQLPSADSDWILGKTTIQFADEQGLVVGSPINMKNYLPAKGENGGKCMDVQFPLGKQPGNLFFTITVDGLTVAGTQERQPGGWRFQTFLLDNVEIPGIATPTPDAPLASETIGDITATLQWAYADANRMAFQLHFDGWKDGYHLNDFSLNDSNGNLVTPSTGGWGDPDRDTGMVTINFEPATPLDGERFTGQLVIRLGSWTDVPDNKVLAEFKFNLDLPVYVATTFNPEQIVTANGIDMILQRVAITPSSTIVYLCYNKPTSADWQLGRNTTLQVGADTAANNGVGLLFDSDYGDLGKGPEPGWTTPITTGRCIKADFLVGHHDQPETMTLTIDTLEQSVSEVISDVEIQRAQEELKKQGIEFSYITLSGNGGGGSDWNIRKKPDGMKDVDVINLIYDVLGYYHPGPWVFTIDIKP